jgi:hypothetical protein
MNSPVHLADLFRRAAPRPTHTIEAVRAAQAVHYTPAPTTLDGWRALLRQAATEGPCAWCGGDGRGVRVHGCEALVCSTSGCPICRGTGEAGDAARRRITEYPGGLLALAVALDAELVARAEAATPAAQGGA